MCEEKHVYTGKTGETATAFYFPVTIPFAQLSNLFTFYPSFPLYLLNSGLTLSIFTNM